MPKYKQELDAISRWIKAVAGLNNLRLSEAPAKIARPVILWENPGRGKDRDLGRYKYVNKVIQFGKLFVNSLEQAAEIQETLLSDLEEKLGVLPVYEKTAQGQEVIATKLKQVTVKFVESENLNIPIQVEYEVTYGRIKPAAAPQAVVVGNRITTGNL